jgi:putative DNA primase/helicase
VLAISIAFAAPLIGLCGGESGGLHFLGKSSMGKTTALYMAGSVFGGGGRLGFIDSWRSTANSLEGVCAAHNDALLCLDELSQLSSRDAGETAYMICNGCGKNRFSRDIKLRKPLQWTLLFLSSGEINLANKMAEDGRGRKETAGQKVRVVEIPADTCAAFSKTFMTLPMVISFRGTS